MSETTTPTTQTTEVAKPVEDTEATKTTVPETTEEPAKPAICANTLLAQGKRHLLCGEVHNAIESLQEASRLLSEEFGEVADECGEAYFFYGKALLELSRMESGVLGNALDGIPDEDCEACPEEEPPKKDGQVENPEEVPEKDREDIANQVYDAILVEDTCKSEKTGEDTKEEVKKDAEVKDDGKKEETDEAKKEEPETMEAETTAEKKEEKTEEKTTDEKKEEAKSKEAEGETKEEKMDTAETETNKEATDEATKEDGEDQDGEEGEEDDEEGDEDEDKENKEKEEDVSNIQLAWEMLDLARVIFLRDGDEKEENKEKEEKEKEEKKEKEANKEKPENKEKQLKAAQAYLKLGEVGLELEQSEQAINDFKECLRIQKKHLEASDRLLAETHYQLGVAYSYSKLYIEAREAFTQAMKVIEDKKAKLQTIIDEHKDKEKQAGVEDTAAVAQQEMEDLGAILPDIQAKIKDTEEEEQQLKQMAKDMMGGTTSNTGFDKPSSSSDAKPIGVKKTDEKVNVLIPRKRKADSETPAVENDPKKHKQENGSGDSAVNGMNGTHKENGSNGDATNGTHKENGDAEMDTAEPKKIVAKTVEDVKKQAEGEATA